MRVRLWSDAQESAPRAGRATTVLLVESLDDARALHAEYLRLHGYRPLEACDTAQALECAADADVVVTGVGVRGPFDGIELVRRLRADARTAGTPIIVLTAWVDRERRERAEQAGCDAFLSKPCPLDQLLGEVRRLIAASRLHDVHATPAKADMPSAARRRRGTRKREPGGG